MYKSPGNFMQPASQCTIPKTQDKNHCDTYTSNWVKIKFFNVENYFHYSKVKPERPDQRTKVPFWICSIRDPPDFAQNI